MEMQLRRIRHQFYRRTLPQHHIPFLNGGTINASLKAFASVFDVDNSCGMSEDESRMQREHFGDLMLIIKVNRAPHSLWLRTLSVTVCHLSDLKR